MKHTRMSILAVLASLAAVAVLGFAASSALPSTANAAQVLMATIGMKSGNAPAPTCKDPFVFSGKKAGCVPCPQGTSKDDKSQTCKALPGTPQKCTTSTDANGVKTTFCVTGVQGSVAGKEATASAMVSGKITILADDTVKGGDKVVQLHSKSCHFDKTFYNSGKDANGHIHFFIDHNGTLCPSKASPTHWVKVSGGMTGRHCDNIAADISMKIRIIIGKVILVKSFAHIVVPIRGSVSVYVMDSCGHAGASVLASATISLTNFAKAKGNVSIATFGQTAFNLKESVKAGIVCTPTQTQTVTTSVTTTAPGTTTTKPGTTTTTQTTTTTPPPTTTVVTTTTPAPPTFTMSWDTINDIPAGTCKPETLHVTSSVAGQVQASPNVGLISTVDCYQPQSGQHSQVTLSVNAGSQDLQVYVYEPADSSATSDTLTAVPLISGIDAQSHTVTTSFTVSHPTRT